jgi:hypothetical protein
MTDSEVNAADLRLMGHLYIEDDDNYQVGDRVSGCLCDELPGDRRAWGARGHVRRPHTGREMVISVTRPSEADRFARFVQRLSSTVGAGPDIHEVVPRVPRDGEVFALVLVGVPGPGFVTGVTYGLSPWQRQNARPVRELCITMRSADPAWPKVPARTVAVLRGMCPFDPGMVIGYKEPYVPPSGLSSLVLASTLPLPALADGIDVAPPGADTDDLVEIVAAYPVYPSEREAVHAAGLGAVFDSDWDPYDPARAAVV